VARQGLIFVISGPSGAGKSTVLQRVLSATSNLHFSASWTTRDPRPGEQDGIDYYFVSPERFQAEIDADNFLEWAPVHQHRYGTPRPYVMNCVLEGKDVILDIDVQGARQVRKREPSIISIFLAPPSLDELARRLHTRHTENEETVNRRLDRARVEMEAIREYNYLVVNVQVGEAAMRLQSIIEAERSRIDRALADWPTLEPGAAT
jgi:guanylate kinase